MKLVKRDKVRVGVIGAGRMARIGHIYWLAKNPHVSLMAIADMKEDLARAAAKTYGAREYYAGAAEMIERAELDAVVVATPPWFHAEPVVMAADKGLHVFCEKPMAITVQDCDTMIKACAAADVFLQIGFNLRFDPAYLKVKELIVEGKIGQPVQVDTYYNVYVPDLDSPLVKRFLEFGERIGLGAEKLGIWRLKDSRTQGGIFQDHGIHYTDLVRWFADSDVEFVAGFRKKVCESRANEDHAVALLRLQNGVSAYVQTSLCLMPGRDMLEKGVVHGAEGSVRFTLDSTWFIKNPAVHFGAQGKVEIYRAPSLLANTWFPVPVLSTRDNFMNKTQMDYFISKITGRFRPHPVLGEKIAAEGNDGRQAIQVVQALYRSSEKCEMVDIR